MSRGTQLRSRGPNVERVRRARRARRVNPVWLRAPVVLLRYPGVLVSLVAAAFLLALVTAAAPLFVSAAGGSAVRHEIGATSPWRAGLAVTMYGQLSADEGSQEDPAEVLRRQDRFLREAVAGIPLVGEGVLSAQSSPAEATGGAGAPSVSVLPVSRQGFTAYVEVVERGPVEGVWIADSAAARLGVGAGDTLTVRRGERVARVRVAGVYRDLAGRVPQEFWQPLQEEIDRSGEEGEPALLLAEAPDMAGLARSLDLVLELRWEFPVERAEISASAARDVAARLQSVARAVEDPFDAPARSLFERATALTELPDVVERAEAAVDSMRGPAGAVSVASRVVALAVIGAAGLFAVRRRRVETTLLSVRGASAPALGLRSAVEALLALAAGAAAGWFAARFLVDALGPGAAPEDAVVRSALVQMAAWELLALALLGVVAGLTAARGAEEPSEPGRFREVLSRAPWEIVALLLAGAAFVELSLRGTQESGRVDALVLLFPVLFVAGFAGLAARVLERLLPRLRRMAPSMPSGYLAARRVAASGRATLLLVTATAAAAGTLVFAGALGGSVETAADHKALVRNGSEARAVVRGDVDLPASPVPASTVVHRVQSARVLPGDARVEVLGVDAETILDAVTWGPGLSDRDPAELLEAVLGPASTGVPVLAAGAALPPQPTLDLAGRRLPVQEVGVLTAFPGMRGEGTMVVMDARALASFLERSDTTIGGVGGHREVWARSSAEELTVALERAGAPPSEVTVAEEVRGSLPFLVVSWSVGLLEGAGVVGGAVALLGLLLHLQARRSRQLAFAALATRMGLRPGSYVASVAMEVGAVLGLALVLGAGLGLVAASLVVPRVDPLPAFPPGPTLVLPLGLLGVAVVVVVVAALVAAFAAQRSADRAKVSEVLRLAG